MTKIGEAQWDASQAARHPEAPEAFSAAAAQQPQVVRPALAVQPALAAQQAQVVLQAQVVQQAQVVLQALAERREVPGREPPEQQPRP